MQDQYTMAENAGLENYAPICRSGNCRTEKCGKRHCVENHVEALCILQRTKYSAHRVLSVATVATVRPICYHLAFRRGCPIHRIYISIVLRLF